MHALLAMLFAIFMPISAMAGVVPIEALVEVISSNTDDATALKPACTKVLATFVLERGYFVAHFTHPAGTQNCTPSNKIPVNQPPAEWSTGMYVGNTITIYQYILGEFGVLSSDMASMVLWVDPDQRLPSRLHIFAVPRYRRRSQLDQGAILAQAEFPPGFLPGKVLIEWDGPDNVRITPIPD